jgi:hypothetical protein
MLNFQKMLTRLADMGTLTNVTGPRSLVHPLRRG